MWNESLNTWSPSAFTVEVSFNVQAGGWMTLVGRDGRDVHNDNGALAPMYFQMVDQGNAENGNALKFLFADNDGNSHQVFSDALDRWDAGAGETAADGTWYSAAAVSDGSTLSLYLMNMSTDTGYSLVDSVDLGTGDTSLAIGNGEGGDWIKGNFTVMRGMYDGRHGDRTNGLVDEVRISDEALTSFVFGDVVPEPASAALVGLGAAALFGRRRRQA